ncbi:MAG TPA: prolipoprotein diacylglyceryl transferase family protein [Terracidiphilus sp.]|nr:prolipoprotein diacylglyceryl transferase family protein [Terracidiphilus sp.]
MHPVLFHIGAVLIPSYGAATALGVLLALGLALRTARVAGRNTDLDAGKVWNLCILSLFAALAAARLLLVIVNWSALRLHPAWLLGLAMVHHPLLAATGALAGAGCAFWYARHNKLPLRATADALVPPLAVGLAFEQLGALASGSGYGVEAGTGVHWAVTYTNPLAAIWSGAPLGVPLHPVQAYAALAFLTLALLLLVWLPVERRKGDVAGLGLMGSGLVIYITELWRDPAGRGSLLLWALDGPQVAAILLVIAGALVLRERVSPAAVSGPASHPFHDEGVKRMGHGASEPGAGAGVDNGAVHE